MKSPRRDHNRDLKSKEEKIDWRARLRGTMREREPVSSSRRDHNRDLKSKEGKSDWRARLRGTMGKGESVRSSRRDHNRDLNSKRGEDRHQITIMITTKELPTIHLQS